MGHRWDAVWSERGRRRVPGARGGGGPVGV